MAGNVSVTGAKGAKKDTKCIICRNERTENCRKKINIMTCPNEKESCKNKNGERRKWCGGYSTGSKGSGTYLGGNILASAYGLPRLEVPFFRFKKGHVFSSGHPLRVGGSIQAHHLIPSELLKGKRWKSLCKGIGYNINCKLNGVYFPADMKLACHTGLQRHRGDHELGSGSGMTYVKRVKKEVEKILKDFKKQPCDGETGKKLIDQLNNLSKKIFNNIKSSTWTIAWDGLNYKKGGIGCAGCTTIPEKKVILKDKLSTELKNSGVNLNIRTYSDMEEIQNMKKKILKKVFCERRKKNKQIIAGTNGLYDYHKEDYPEGKNEQMKKFEFNIAH